MMRTQANERQGATCLGALAGERATGLFFYSSHAYEPAIGGKIDALARVRAIGSWLHKTGTQALDAERKLPTTPNY